MTLTREEHSLLLNLFALAYAVLLMVGFGLSASRELLDSHYVWFIIWGIPLPVLVRLACGGIGFRRDALVWTMAYVVGCMIANLIVLVIIAVDWAEQGSFYLNLNASSTGFWPLYVLLGMLIALVIDSSILLALTSASLKYTTDVKKRT